MAEYDIKLDGNKLIDLLSNNEQFPSLIKSIIDQVLEAQMAEHLAAESYERTEARQGYRNGYRIRRLSTRIGELVLRVPQTRDGSFSTEIFKRYQRKEQAFVLGLMEMYLSGVSTRKVSQITEELCGVSFSKSTVSSLSAELDFKVKAFKERRLDDKLRPFIIVDAISLNVRKEGVTRGMSMLIAHGVNQDGYRETLGFWLGDSESEITWSQLFEDLKARGLKGVDLVVSDNHSGLVKSLKKHFQGAAWQRCQTHFMRNVLGHAPRGSRKEIAEHLKTILHSHARETAQKLGNEFVERYEKTAKKAVDCFQRGFDSAINVLSYPIEYRQRLRTTNMAERVNREIRRRQQVTQIFPNEASAIRLIGALLADWHDEWLTGKRYLDMELYWEWKGGTSEEAVSNVVKISI